MQRMPLPEIGGLSCLIIIGTKDSAVSRPSGRLRCCFFAQPVPAEDVVNMGYFGDVAIKGYDPVAYFTQNQAVEGSPQYSHHWLGATWYFASAEHRDMFMRDPAKYAPQYGGYCADGVSFRDGYHQC